MSEDRVARMQRQILGIIQKEMQGWMNDLLRGMLDPNKIISFLRGMGIDMSQLPGMVGQPGFDPYVILGLDKSASDEEVRQAYRKVMSTIHPDKAGPELTTLAAIVNAAYEMIKRERGWQ